MMISLIENREGVPVSVHGSGDEKQRETRMFKIDVLREDLSGSQKPVALLRAADNDHIEQEAVFDQLEWEKVASKLELMGDLYLKEDQVLIAKELGYLVDGGMRMSIESDDGSAKKEWNLPYYGLPVMIEGKIRL